MLYVAQNFQSIPASLSSAGTGLLIITYIIFPHFRKLKHVELVFYIALCDFIVAVVISLVGITHYAFCCRLTLNIFINPLNHKQQGNYPTGSAVCWLQEVLLLAFGLSSVFWNIFVAYQIYLVVIQRESLPNMRYIHMFCWLFPVITSLLSLTMNNVGKESPYLFCQLIPRFQISIKIKL